MVDKNRINRIDVVEVDSFVEVTDVFIVIDVKEMEITIVDVIA